MLTLTVLVVVLVGAVSTTPAYADDGTTGEPTPAPTEESPPAEEPAIEPAPAETVETILEGIPEGTEVVVINEGVVEPLATEAAAQIILQNDPIWCPGAALPSDPGCTAGYATVTELIANLGTKSGAGTIYFTSTYATNDAYLDHSNPNLANLTDLSIQGGWNGSTAAPTVGGITTFNSVPLSIVNWIGNVTLNDIIVDGAAIDSGIYVQTAGNIILDNTSATDNGFDGADLINYGGTGNVTVNGGNFSGNDQAGLYIASQGVVNLTDVIVDNTSALVNDSYDGAIIDNSYGTENVSVTGSTFTQNLWDGLYVKSAGIITLNGVIASNNLETGAYLNALSGTGGITISNSTFSSNGDWGINAFADDGSITVSNVSVNGGGTGENGAWFKSFQANVSVSNSTFSNHTKTGLLAVAGGQVTLDGVIASSNAAGNGAEIYSINNFACFGTQDITVNVNNGTYSGNGEYGLYAEPGSAATVTFTGTQTYSPANGLGNTFINPFVNPCPPPDPNKPTNEGKPSNVVNVPNTGGEPVLQDCENFSSTTLRLEAGTSVKVRCPFSGTSRLSEITNDELPGRLPNVFTFGSAIEIGLADEAGDPVPVMTEGGLLTISFVIPEELKDKRLSILYWDPTANNGQGDWIELPLERFGGENFPLHPDDPDDWRMISSGLEQSGNTVSVTVNFPGLFVLVAR